MKHRERHFRFDAGLQTTQPEESTPAFWFTTFRNVRTTRAGLDRRAGRVLLATIETEGFSGVYGGGEKATGGVNADQWALGSGWTVEALVNVQSLLATGEFPVCGFAAASDYPFRIFYDCTTDGEATLKATVYDLSGTSVTVALSVAHEDDDTVAIQLIRDGGTVTLRANGDEEATGALAYTGTPVVASGFIVGGDNSGSFKGNIDFVRCQRIVKPDQRGGQMRLLNPRAPSVVCDYLGYTVDGWAEDRSRFENHAKDDGSITTASPIGLVPTAIQNISLMRGSDKGKRLVVVAGGYRYEGGM